MGSIAGKPRGSYKKTPFDYEQTRRRLSNFEDLAPYLAGYPEPSGLMGYWFRLLPEIDNSLIGIAESNILKTAKFEEMTEDFAAQKWGRGRYMLKVSDSNRTGVQEMVRVIFDVTDPELTPIYDPRALLVNKPSNADEVARLLATGVMVRDAATGQARVKSEYMPVAPPVPSSVPSAVPAAEPDLLSRDLLTQLVIKLVDRGAQNPRDQLTQTIEVARLLVPPAAGAAPGGVTPEILALHIELAELRGRAAAAVQVAAPPASASGGAFDAFDTFVKIQEFLKSQGGGASGGGESNLVGQIFAGVKELLPAVPAILAGVDRLRTVRAPGLTAPGNASFGPVPASPGVRAGFGGYPDPPVPPEMAGANSGYSPTPKPLDLSEGDVFVRFTALARAALDAQQRGTSGFDFAGFLCAAYTPGGLELYRMMRADGTSGVMGFVSQMPEVVAGGPAYHKALEVWLDDFFEFDPDGTEVAA